MTIRACLPGLVEEGKLEQSQADEIAATYDGIRQQYDGEMSAAAADAMASKATIDAMERKLLRRKRLEAGALLAKSDMLKKMDGFRGGRGDGPIDPKAAEAFFDNVPGAGYSNVEGRRKAIIARSHAMMDGILAKFHAGVTGVSGHKADLADMVREVFGEDSGNVAAKQLAKAWMDASEMLRRRFNQAGGDIGKMDRWGLPQSHDTRAVRHAGFDTWRDFIWDKLDRERMTDADSERPMTDSQLNEALRNVWETIRSDGWNNRNPGGAGASSLANRRADPRFLQFKSADDWMAYAHEFGTGSAYNSMMSHVTGMSRDIAMMEILGPNPNQGVKWLKDTIVKSAETDESPGSKAVERAGAAGKRIDRLYGEITGSTNQPENRNISLAASAIRSFETAAKLGSAFISAVPTDPMFGIMARKVNGLPAAGMIRDYVKLFAPGLADKQLAIRQGMIAEEWSRRTAGQSRALGEELSGELASRLAEGVLRVSGLQRYTQAGRWAFGMEFVGHLTDQREKAFGELGGLFRDSLQRYGIDEAGWDKIRATPLEQDGGADWIKPVNVEDRELGDKLMELIHSEMLYAVPEMDLRTRALFTSLAPKGTIAGELARSALLFKGFGITSMLMQSRRIMELANRSPWAAINYAGGLVILTTLGGGLALQMKALAGGRDPRPMDDANFWGAATLQGGGWGIFGDFLQSQQSRFGGGFAGTLAGPMVSDVQTIADTVKSKHPAWAAARTARQFLPGGSLWFARTAFDRNITDQVQEALDPSYRDSWRKMAQRAKEQRTQLWWQPGKPTPDRAPDMSNAWPGQ